MSSGKWRPFCLGLNVLTSDDKCDDGEKTNVTHFDKLCVCVYVCVYVRPTSEKRGRSNYQNWGRQNSGMSENGGGKLCNAKCVISSNSWIQMSINIWIN